MFKKLRMKLTLFNIGVIGSILAIIVLIVFLGSPEIVSKRINLEMWQAVFRGGSYEQSHGRSRDNSKDYSYVIVDLKGNIVEKPSPQRISDERMKMLVEKALAVNAFFGEIKLDDYTSYLFSKIVIDKDQGSILVFIDSGRRTEIVISLIIQSLIVILISLVLIFWGGLFITDKALIPIKKAWQKQMDFTADASHELRTPIAVIRTNLELVLGNSDETVESQKKWLQNILEENKRMTKLVDDLLDLSRADTEQQIHDLSCFNLDKAIGEAITPFEPFATSQGIALESRLDSRVDFYGDKDRIKQLSVILVDNALKYTNHGGKVYVEIKKGDKSVEIAVSDTGEGIEKEHLEKIFDRFYRVDKARTRKKGGSGLGLAIAKWIVNEHHGSINVDSTPGKGTRFVILLPYSQH